MTKEQIIKLYIADLNNLVADSDAKRNRIIDLEGELEAIKQGQSLPIDSVVGSYSLKVGDKIKMPSGLKAEVIKTKVKVKDEFGGEYYLSDIEAGYYT